MNQNWRQIFGERVRKDQPHTDHVMSSMDKLADIADRVRLEQTKFQSDRNLTATGVKSKLSERVRGEHMRALALATRPVRKSLKQFDAQRAGLGMPKIDKGDVVGEMRRAELRSYLRTLKPADRIAMAESAAGDAELAMALFMAPALLSGLDDQSLGMPQAGIYDRMHQAAITRMHGPALKDLDDAEGDYRNLEALAVAVQNEVFQASGLSREGFIKEMAPLEASADA